MQLIPWDGKKERTRRRSKILPFVLRQLKLNTERQVERIIRKERATAAHKNLKPSNFDFFSGLLKGK
jgi:hypothetical protein